MRLCGDGSSHLLVLQQADIQIALVDHTAPAIRRSLATVRLSADYAKREFQQYLCNNHVINRHADTGFQSLTYSIVRFVRGSGSFLD